MVDAWKLQYLTQMDVCKSDDIPLPDFQMLWNWEVIRVAPMAGAGAPGAAVTPTPRPTVHGGFQLAKPAAGAGAGYGAGGGGSSKGRRMPSDKPCHNYFEDDGRGQPKRQCPFGDKCSFSHSE